jgi:hypothetical protein
MMKIKIIEKTYLELLSIFRLFLYNSVRLLANQKIGGIWKYQFANLVMTHTER